MGSLLVLRARVTGNPSLTVTFQVVQEGLQLPRGIMYTSKGNSYPVVYKV